MPRDGRPAIYTHCTVYGCNNKHYALGKCRSHYSQAKKRKTVKMRPAGAKHDLSVLGQNIRSMCEAKKLTLRELAAKAGIGYNTLSHMLYRGPHSPTLYNMEYVAQALQVPLWQLLLEDEEAIELEQRRVA